MDMYDYYGEMSHEEHCWHEEQYEMWVEIPKEHKDLGIKDRSEGYGFTKDGEWSVCFRDLQSFYDWCKTEGLLVTHDA